MKNNKYQEAKDKVAGNLKETTGKITGDKEMELKGKFQKGLGQAREVASDVVDEMEDVKDMVIGSVKESTGKITDNKNLQLKGKIQKAKSTSSNTNKILGGLATLTGLYALKRIFTRNKE